MIAERLLDPAVLPVATLLVKVTVVLATAATLVPLLRWKRASASVRHLAWLGAIVAVLAMPVLGFVLPWQIQAIHVRMDQNVVSSSEDRGLSAPEFPSRPVEQGSAVTGVSNEPTLASGRLAKHPSDLGALQILFGLYLCGVGVVLLRLIAGHWSLHRLAARAQHVTDPEWVVPLREIEWEMHATRPVALLRSTEVTMPMTWGTRRPTIMLPACAESWSKERRRVVLLHEMAHVFRYDCLTQLAGSIACALYWFHPLAWHAARQLRIERELSCDDQVLAAGMGARAYVIHLLEVAQAHDGGFAPVAAVSMARPSQLEGRMLAALDSLRSRRTVSGRGVLRTGPATIALILPLAAMQASTSQAISDDGLSVPALSASDGVPPPPEAQAQGRTVRRTLPARSGDRLTVNLETGGYLNVIGWDSAFVSVRAELGGRDWERTRVDVTSDSSGVRLTSSQLGKDISYSTSHRFEVRVPLAYDVNVRSNGGGIEIRALRGRFSGRTNGGPLHLTRLGGVARLSTNGGEIVVTDAQLDGEVRTNGGDVRFHNVVGSLKGHTNGGTVIRTTGTAGSVSTASIAEPLTIRRAGGPINVDDAPLGADLRTGGGKIYVRSAKRFVNAQTGGGEIAIRAVDGRVYASTGAGDVRVAVHETDSSPHDVEIRSGSGTVELSLPAGFEAELDIETAYTNNFGRRVRIQSDFPLTQSESRHWENISGGTPRKFVRGVARLGRATHRVRIRTVNGDVIVHRAGAQRTFVPDRGLGNSECVGVSCTTATVVTGAVMKPEGGSAYVSGSNPPRDSRLIDALVSNAPEQIASAELEQIAFGRPDAETQRAAVQELNRLGEAAVTALIRVSLEHPGEEARTDALQGLGLVASDDAVATLHRVAVSDHLVGVQREAVRALAATHDRDDVQRNIRPFQIRNMLAEIARGHGSPAVRAEATRLLASLSRG